MVFQFVRFNLAFIMLLVTGTLFAQNESKNIDYYTAIGVSMANTSSSTWSESSFPSVEFGVMKQNLSLGLVICRSSLANFDNDDASNYCAEIKTAISFNLGEVDGYAMAGFGNYLSTNQYFIEYGLGASYALKNNLGFFTQVSNWDNTWYLTPGLTYSF